MKKAFTLAEIMIVLTVIGILTAILLPVAFQSAPDEKVMKFKKANSTLGTVIRELVNSDRYYKNGFLGELPAGTRVTNTAYFCNTIAELLSTKTVNCTAIGGTATATLAGTSSANLNTLKSALDTACDSVITTTQIETTDKIKWYIPGSATTFGKIYSGTIYEFAPPDLHCSGSTSPCSIAHNVGGFDGYYKVVCFDVDALGGSGDKGAANVAPFGYGVRGDGRIIPGARADKWMQYSTQKN